MATVAKQPAARLHVGGLPRELLDDELRARFAPFGAVRSVEVLREKPESPFHRRDPDEAPDAGAEAGGRGARVGGRGARVGGRGARPVAPPCRGFAYVELTPSDAKSLNRCVTLYNGCKWKGGVMRVQRAKPRWNDRLRMEREGAVLGLDGAEISAAEAAAAARARRHADAGPSSGGADAEPAPNPSLPPLRRGDELEIDGRSRHSKVTVTVGRGAKQHVRAFSDSDDAVAFAPDWTPFDEDASWRTARRLCQLPGMKLWKPKPPARRLQRRDEHEVDVEVVGEEVEDESSSEGFGSDSGEASASGSGPESNDDGREDARFALPREFFASAAAAERAARRVDGANGASDTRERFGVGPVSARGERTDDERGKKRRGDSVEMRVLSAFLGDDEDEDETEAEDETRSAAAKARTSVPSPPKKARKTASSASAAADPVEGGVPMTARAAKWWETTTRPSAAADDETPRPSAGAGGGALAKDFFAARLVAAANASNAPARDFFRAAAPAPFVPRSREEDDEEDDDASASVSASDESGDEDDSEETVSEDERLGDWRDDEDDEDDDSDEDDADVSESAEASSGESFSEDSGPGSEDDDEDEDESEGVLGVVEFD